MILSLRDRLTQAAFLIQPAFPLTDGLHPPVGLAFWQLGIPLSPGTFLTIRLANGLTHLVVPCPPSLLETHVQGFGLALPAGFSVTGFQQHQSLVFLLEAQAVYATLPITGLWIPDDHLERMRLLLEAQTTGWR
ncbi:hypothetical protein [Deinococcus aquatilis]|uniref:hypothetical protein n=1 Tax=Deinococcus aquatilis TaxID=519440 RepID=UPI00037C2CA8|nr:hypothetical protein [Deinococcus aquatilis]